MNVRSFQFIVQITLFQLKFLIQYRKFPIRVGPNLYVTGSKTKNYAHSTFMLNPNLQVHYIVQAADAHDALLCFPT